MVEHIDHNKPVKEFDKKSNRRNKSVKKWLSSNFLSAKTSSKKVTDVRDDISHGGISESGHNNNNKINNSSHSNRQVIPAELSPSRSMPKEIRYDSPVSESELSVISGTTDMDSKAGPPVVAFQGHAPFHTDVQRRPHNLFHIDTDDDLDDGNDGEGGSSPPPNVERKIVLLPDLSENDTVEDSLFLNSTSTHNHINGDPTKTALRTYLTHLYFAFIEFSFFLSIVLHYTYTQKLIL